MNRTKGILASALTVVAVAIGTIASPLAGVAQAYSSTDCQPGFDSIDQVDTFKADGGKVDLGDGIQGIGLRAPRWSARALGPTLSRCVGAHTKEFGALTIALGKPN